MTHAMVCLLAAAGVVVLAGCAQESGSHPSYLGLTDLTGDAAAASVDGSDSDTSDALRHIQSNKVLGAMAFQKVTGQTVDPDSLLGHGSE
ncbi:MAG: hypothetical protein ABWZ86_01190 [Hyphomicrobium sp.]